MDLNRLNKVVGSKKGLERQDIIAYLESKNEEEKNHIEQKSLSSDFDRDAFEGWEQMQFDLSSMKKLDDRFLPKKPRSWMFWTIPGVLVVGFLVLYFTVFYESKKSNDHLAINSKAATSAPQTNQIVLEETDVLLSDAIKAFEETKKSAQISPEQIQSQFAEILVQNKEIDSVSTLPLNKPASHQPQKTLLSKRVMAKEIYLSDFKLIDYRKYRSNPIVPIQQLILTGTPAYKETGESPEMSSEWKTVEIPYIDYLEKSIRILNRADYKKSLARFELILATYPDDINGHFYAGLCLFNFGEYEKAILHFQQCRTSSFSNFDEEAVWMMALSYEQAGQEKNARALFSEIAESDGYYKKQALEKMH